MGSPTKNISTALKHCKPVKFRSNVSLFASFHYIFKVKCQKKKKRGKKCYFLPQNISQYHSPEQKLLKH